MCHRSGFFRGESKQELNKHVVSLSPHQLFQAALDQKLGVKMKGRLMSFVTSFKQGITELKQTHQSRSKGSQKIARLTHFFEEWLAKFYAISFKQINSFDLPCASRYMYSGFFLVFRAVNSGASAPCKS